MTAASASGMVRKLAELGLVSHVPYKGVELTDGGARDGARGHPPPPAARAVPGREPGAALGPRARRGRGARARPLRGARGPDRRQARQPHPRPARRPDPHPRPRDRGERDGEHVLARARRGRHLRAHLRLRSGDAALPGRPRHRPRERASRSSRSSPSTARCSPASATTSTCSAAGWPGRCGWRGRARDPTAAPRGRRRHSPARGRRSRAAGAQPAAQDPRARRHPRPPRDARPRLRRRRRLHRPGQLRDQHRRRREVRLPARLGDHRREPDGDARAVPVGQGRRGDGQEPAGAVPRGAPAASDLGPVGAGRDHRDRDRPRRVRRRGDRAEPAVRGPGLHRRADDRRSSPSRSWRCRRAATGASSWRSRRCSGSCCSASPTTSRRSASTRAASPAAWCPAFQGTDSDPDRRRHPRRDGHAARRLPALRADAVRASRPTTTASGASSCASSAST